MADMTSYGPWSRTLGARLGKLRSRGQSTILAALAPHQAPSAPALPTLQGEALARHHLGLAIDALGANRQSKPETFRQLRLLINKLEQGAMPPPAPAPQPALASAVPTLNRRARLLNRAFESAQVIASWRAQKTVLEQQR